MDYKKIGDFICELRKSKDMTQKDLADKLHITVQAVSKWERGLGCPDISLFKPLSKIFDVSINELMNGEIISEENVKEKADDAILNALNHSHGVVKKRNKQLIIIITGILLTIYGYNTYGFYNDYSTLFLFPAFISNDIIKIVGVVAGIVGIITGLIISRNKKRFIIIMTCILSIIIGLNIYCAYNEYILVLGTVVNISNIIRFIMIIIGISTAIIGIMFGKSKIKTLLAIITIIILLFSSTYVIDTLTYSKIKVSIFNRHYDYSEILKKANDIKNDKNKEVVEKVIAGIKGLQKQQKYIDKLNNKKISIFEGTMFIFNYSNFFNFSELKIAYDTYKGHANDLNYDDKVSKDIYYVMFGSIADEGYYKYCSMNSKENTLFPSPAYYLCDFPLQLYYELEHVNGVRAFEEVLDSVK